MLIAGKHSFETSFSFFEGKSIMVTGGTGSFGNHFVRSVLDNVEPRRLIIFSRDELKQYEMQMRFKDHPRKDCLRFFIGDVRDRNRLTIAMKGVDFVIHAAALKQVPAAEYNPTECIRTNINGAENVTQAASDNNVKQVIALSTDKAANPINLYGATKLASDKVFVAANNLSGNKGTRYSVVRYGNVINSRGSVIPLFKRLLQEGKTTLPITDKEMTRFWITLDQSVAFVVSSMQLMRGGEIFVPKIPSMKIVDLAWALQKDVDFEEIGIRPGEKMHEVMIPKDHAANTFELEDRYFIEPSFAFWGARKQPKIKGAKQVEQGFEYSSDSNKEWLSDENLRTLSESL